MNEREMLMRKMSAAQFAAWELHIYLDTHPDDCSALESYNKYKQRYATLAAEYESKYGPITAGQNSGSAWCWTNDPWPWENKEEVQ